MANGVVLRIIQFQEIDRS